MTEARQLGETLGRMMARQRDPGVVLNVPDVHVRAELDASGVEAVIRESVEASGGQFRAAVEALQAALTVAAGERAQIDFAPIVEALRAAETPVVVDYSKAFQAMTAAIESQAEASRALRASVEDAAERIEAALTAKKTITYDAQGRVSSVKVG